MRLFKKSPNGTMRFYDIESIPAEKGYHTQWGTISGVVTEKYIPVYANMSGRTVDTQIELEMHSKINKMLDSGYKATIEEAEQSQSNQLDLARPMLAKKYDDTKPVDYGSVIQYKYDGHRCLIHNDGERIRAYSRRGVLIDNIGHITEGLDIPEGATLDGELYLHGASLQRIHSLIKRKQERTKDLKYIVYDQIEDKPYITRLNGLSLYNICNIHIELAPSVSYYGGVSIKDRLDEAIKLGYEGLIIRFGIQGYQCGKRSNSLIKVKRWMDDVFTVIDVFESKDGWAVLDFGEFSASAPGTIEEKEEILDNADYYIGQEARVEYAKLTKAGVPFHPVVTNFIE